MTASNSSSVIKGSKGVDDVIKDYRLLLQEFTHCKSFSSVWGWGEVSSVEEMI